MQYKVEWAEENSTLTEEQAKSVVMADLIVKGVERASGLQTYGLAEISIKADGDSVQRAWERAEWLSLATSIPTAAVVIAANMPQEVRELAVEIRVRIIQHPAQ